MYPLPSRHSWRLAGLAVGLFAVAQSGSAQGSHSTTTDVHSAPSSPEHPATLIGAVVDSIHMGPLVGATVLLNGTTLSTQTDDHGKFRIDSIPPGSYRIAVFHPLLDTLGVSIGTMPLSMGPDSVRELVLATPSALSVVSTACPVAKRRLGPGAILGHISDPDTHAPLDSVRVSLAWTEIQASKDIGVRRTASIREGMSDASGAFAICGIPAGVKGTIRADRGRAQTAEVPVALDESPLLIQSLTMALVAGTTDSAAATGQAVLTGRVTDAKGLPVVGAQVSVQGAHASVTSATDGTFRLVGLPSGTRDVLVRRVGFTATQIPVELSKV
ncbi:MAG TPA: carboxypeptidase regulatory-like domain-containing protein, partial [Gemmatimonadaceae bacterium]|nr:carboxypeptidase regulatory-like domain-containing protein [Gemmatimonadaceae bacterium]